MKQIPFGNTGETVSEMCLGTMMFGGRTDEEEAKGIVDAAVDAGATFLDTAAKYCDGRTEEILGRALEGKRDKVFLGTKVWRGVDRASILGEMDDCLRRLRTDRVDLYMIHWPQEGMDPEEIMGALAEVVRAGKACYVGCCNFPAWLFARHNAIAAANGWPLLVCNQIPYNPVERGVEVEILPQALAEGVAITVYRPLLMGLLAGKYRPGQPLPQDARGGGDERLGNWLARYGDGVEFLLNMASDKGVAPAQLAVAWVRSHPAVACPIVGVSRLTQFQESLGAFEVDLSPEERIAIADAFGAEVKEEAGGRFPELRRATNLLRS